MTEHHTWISVNYVDDPRLNKLKRSIPWHCLKLLDTNPIELHWDNKAVRFCQMTSWMDGSQEWVITKYLGKA